MIELGTSRSTTLGLLAITPVLVAILLAFRWERLARLAAPTPLVIAVAAEVLMIVAVLLITRPRLRLQNGEFEFRPRFGPSRRIALHSTSAVIWAPRVRLSATKTTDRFAILTVDAKPFVVVDGPLWNTKDMGALLEASRPKSVLVPANVHVAQVIAQWPAILSWRERNPALAILRTIGIALLVLVVGLALLFLLASTL